ncbi:MAG: Na(+)-translocating NADH-quinone reductase subunit A [Thermoguttaceae bacterium]|jgi:Na+-transporting NADH:ubiquinone oxidoreductase subunit A|nr:Na(+)-translocating NADH-quinone reductase subunit A [Thermoguttaceae bacterium]
MDTANCKRIRIGKGLNLPIAGQPRQEIGDGRLIRHVAVLGPDYVGMRPTMVVAEGDAVREGQVLLEDKKTPGVLYTAPGAGRVVAINRGARRVLESVVIELAGDACETFSPRSGSQLERLGPEAVRKTLLKSGLWTALRTRPFSKVPAPESTPNAVFVTAVDTHPLAASPEVIIAERPDDFVAGLMVLGQLGGERVYVCKSPGASIPGADLTGIEQVEFEGPHPAGLPGTHIHFLAPVGRHKAVWYLNYQDVMAVGALFLSGRLDHRRVIAIGGPRAREPRLVRTRVGANLTELLEGEVEGAGSRVVSGSVFGGRTVRPPLDFLGRYHLQATVLAEDAERRFLGWLQPGWNRHSILNLVASKLLPGRRLPLTASLQGSRRAIFPVGVYERVMPLDTVALFLLRALAVGDIDRAEALGALELDEEDLALCTYVCPGKNDFAPMLRRSLTTIEKEG